MINETILIVSVILVITVWDSVWKLTAAYRAANNKHKYWFVFLLMVNSIGILPIIYFITHKRHKQNQRGGKNGS